MKVRFCRPKLYIDLSVWLVYESPKNGQFYRHKTPIAANMLDMKNPVEELQKHLEKKHKTKVELIDCGDWDNIRDRQGRVPHPMEKGKFLEQRSA